MGSKAGKLASLPALVERDARRSDWVGIKACLGIARDKTLWLGGSKAGKLASLPANSQVCLLWYNAVQDAMVGREQSRQTRKFACFGITRRKRDGWAGSNAGKLASLLALLWRGARRYGWVGSKASKLASLPALVERDARRSGWVGIKACLACLLASLLACLLQGRFSAPRQLPGFRSLLSGIYVCP